MYISLTPALIFPNSINILDVSVSFYDNGGW